MERFIIRRPNPSSSSGDPPPQALQDIPRPIPQRKQKRLFCNAFVKECDKDNCQSCEEDDSNIKQEPTAAMSTVPKKKSVSKKCEHGRRRNTCKECGGSQICKHNRQRNTCKECGGKSLCEHGRQRNICKECGGTSICKHNRRRNTCKECTGKSICQHERLRNSCKQCRGSQICKHDRLRNKCKECGGSQICEHRRQRAQCKECGGSQICEHGRERAYCKECTNFVCDIEGCPLKGHKFAGSKGLMRHMRSHHTDHPKARTKTKELKVHDALTKAGLDFTYQHFIPFAACSLQSETKHAFVDFVLPTTWGNICLEVDETQHSSYPAECDVRRDFDIAAASALGSNQKLVILHYNPDSFKIANQTVTVPQRDRIAKLLDTIRTLPEPSNTFERVFLYYDSNTADSALPTIAKHWPGEVRELSRKL